MVDIIINIYYNKLIKAMKKSSNNYSIFKRRSGWCELLNRDYELALELPSDV